MQLVSIETQLINVIESTWHSVIPLRHTCMMFTSSENANIACFNFQLNFVSSLKKKEKKTEKKKATDMWQGRRAANKFCIHLHIFLGGWLGLIKNKYIKN